MSGLVFFEAFNSKLRKFKNSRNNISKSLNPLENGLFLCYHKIVKLISV